MGHDNGPLHFMSLESLKETLKEREDMLQEIEEERKFVLGQTGLHVSGKRVKEYEELLDRISNDIEDIRRILHRKEKG